MEVPGIALDFALDLGLTVGVTGDVEVSPPGFPVSVSSVSKMESVERFHISFCFKQVTNEGTVTMSVAVYVISSFDEILCFA